MLQREIPWLESSRPAIKPTTISHIISHKTTMNLEQIWIERTTVNEKGNRVPTFWNPTPLSKIEGDTYDGNLMARIVSLGLVMELPVGELVTSQMRRIPGLNVGIVEKVLKSNISDEARHDKGMHYAEEFLTEAGYTVDTSPVHQFLKDTQRLPYHPITLAACLEVTLFLPMLALARMHGGQAFNRWALGINEDEQRHVRVNSSLASALGEPLPTCHQWIPIRDAVIDYLMDRHPDKDLFYRASNELYHTGDSPTLNAIPAVAAVSFMSPFTVTNSEKYARTVS